MKKNIEDSTKDTKEKAKTLILMMAMILSQPYEIQEWTEELIVLLMKNKKISKVVSDKFSKEFVPKFFDKHAGLANINERSLSSEVYSELKHTYNPVSYCI